MGSVIFFFVGERFWCGVSVRVGVWVDCRRGDGCTSVLCLFWFFVGFFLLVNFVFY